MRIQAQSDEMKMKLAPRKAANAKSAQIGSHGDTSSVSESRMDTKGQGSVRPSSEHILEEISVKHRKALEWLAKR